jgi:hypothetical protein
MDIATAPGATGVNEGEKAKERDVVFEGKRERKTRAA